jgi:hypothetical protein
VETVYVEIYQAKVFAVAAVLPLELKAGCTPPREVQFAEDVTAVFAFDGTLSGCEKALLVFWTKYSHCGCSLRRRVAINANAVASAVQDIVRKAVLCSKHKRLVSDVASTGDEEERLFNSRRSLMPPTGRTLQNQLKRCNCNSGEPKLSGEIEGQLMGEITDRLCRGRWATKSGLRPLD